ncbi:11073_t:CDS:2, partial [Paraglomus occultum]
VVINIRTTVDIQWQDMTIEKDVRALDLVPYLNVDDQDVWPADYVLAKTDGKTGTERMGIVQRVNAVDRLATVRWFGQEPGKLEDESEELSLYEIVVRPDLQAGLGDKVLLWQQNHCERLLPLLSLSNVINDNAALEEIASRLKKLSDEEAKTLQEYEESAGNRNKTDRSLDWFGEIAQLTLDGRAVISLANKSTAVVPLDQVVVLEDSDDEEDDDDVNITTNSNGNNNTFTFHNRTIHDYEDWSSESDASDAESDSDSWETVDEDDENDNTAEKEEWKTYLSENEMEIDDPAGLAAYGWLQFAILEEPPENHRFLKLAAESRSRACIQRIVKEHGILRKSLPDGILVRAFENRMDLFRVLIFGSSQTPYEDAPFLFDFAIPHNFPNVPPLAFFHSWTGGIGRINPNLYEDGKVCLSLLNTWHGKDETEVWTPSSSLLQLFISLQALVLTRSPWYNEAGYEKFVGTEEAVTSVAVYNEKAYILSLRAIAKALGDPPGCFSEEIKSYYFKNKALLRVINKAEKVIANSESDNNTTPHTSDDVVVRVSKGALKLLKGTTETLKTVWKENQ